MGWESHARCRVHCEIVCYGLNMSISFATKLFCTFVLSFACLCPVGAAEKQKSGGSGRESLSVRKVVLDTTPHDPYELAVAGDGRVFYIERLGAVRECLPESQGSRLVGKIEVFEALDDGLLGLALDPAFLDNGWMYFFYSSVAVSENWVSRFTLEDGVLDLDSEKVLLKIRVQRDTPPCHTGGSLAFDSHGNLLISTGDNINPFKSNGFSPTDERPGHEDWDAQSSSSNTNDLRGKVLRVTPQPDGSITIPKGNLFEPGQLKTRPEIYVMGCRNPFRISVDVRSDALYWGEVGPDAQSADVLRGPAGYDEVNQARKAGNFGWPHFVGNNKAYRQFDFETQKSGSPWDAAIPLNRSVNNTGLEVLPPSQLPLIWYPYAASEEFLAMGAGGRCAMAGPVYYFDVELNSTRKLPMELDHCLLAYDWMRGRIVAAKLDGDERLVELNQVFSGLSFKRPMDMELGPDGALYIIEWGSAYGGSNDDAQIVRVEAGEPAVEASASNDSAAETILFDKYLAVLPRGDAKLGKELFDDVGKSLCMTCHKVGGEGGAIGPALDGCGSRLSPEELLESILFPTRQVTMGYGYLSIELEDGASYSGTLKFEDATSLHLVLPDGDTVKVQKAAIKVRGEVTSGMPDIAGVMSPESVANLVQYLASLRESSKAGVDNEIRVLIVTGHDDGPWHDWRKRTAAIKDVLASDARMQVDVLESPHALRSTDLSPYHVVFLNWSAGLESEQEWQDPDERARSNLVDYVQGGGGLFVLHFACYAFRDWTGYSDLVGRVWDGTGHDPRGPFSIQVADTDHPVFAGWKPRLQVDDELYTCLEGTREIQTLATARSVIKETDHPMAFTLKVGQGRVFHTPLGHDAKACKTPDMAELIRRGTAWAAKRRAVPSGK